MHNTEWPKCLRKVCYTYFMNASFATATLGAGCFWCSEAIFSELRGVLKVTSGYSGGRTPNPTYTSIHQDETGHAEVVQIEYDPTVISYDQLLEVFFLTHDPTTMNRQGADVGPEYRSIILYHDESQRAAAEAVKRKIEADRIFDRPIVTEIVPYAAFYPAEAEHRNFYATHPDQAYCQVVIDPKIAKFRQKFAALRKEDSQLD